MTIFGAQNLDKHYKRKSIKLQYWRSQKHSRKSLETDSSGHVCVTHHGFTDHSYCWSISRLLRHTHTHTHKETQTLTHTHTQVCVNVTGDYQTSDPLIMIRLDVSDSVFSSYTWNIVSHTHTHTRHQLTLIRSQLWKCYMLFLAVWIL